LFQFKRFGTDVDKNARDPHGDGDQRLLKGAEGIMVMRVSSALHVRHANHSRGLWMCRDWILV